MISSQQRQKLIEIALRTLDQNVRSIAGSSYLAAGSHHFNTLWTRDFCFAAKGLIYLDKHDIFLSHFLNLISYQRPSDGLLPRVIDSISTRVRVSLSCAGYVLPFLPTSYPLGSNLKPEFVDEHGTEAIDSNLLFIHSYLDWLIYLLTKSKDPDASLDLEVFQSIQSCVQQNPGLSRWSRLNQDQTLNTLTESLIKAVRYYDGKSKDGAIYQSAFADWQDSTERTGFTFYTNVLMVLLRNKIKALASSCIHLRGLLDAMDSLGLAPSLDSFYDDSSGLYRSVKGRKFYSLDGHLLLLDHWVSLRKILNHNSVDRVQDSFRESLRQVESYHPEKIWQNLKQSELFADLPGFNTFPSYPKNELSLAVKLVGLQEYHGRIYWTWLMALTLKLANWFGDTQLAQELVDALLSSSLEKEVVTEVLVFDRKEKVLKEFRSTLYRSESPFSWGAGMLAYSLLS